MTASRWFVHYYQTLRDMHYAVFGVIASILYSLIYICCIPFVLVFSPGRKKPSHTAWNKWSYKSQTLEDAKKQY
jgi:hypothetical protein